MGPGRPIDSHHRGHQALIVGSLYQGTSESFEVIYILHIIYIIYYILYLLYYIAYSIHIYIHIYIRPIPNELGEVWPALTHTYIYVYT